MSDEWINGGVVIRPVANALIVDQHEAERRLEDALRRGLIDSRRRDGRKLYPNEWAERGSWPEDWETNGSWVERMTEADRKNRDLEPLHVQNVEFRRRQLQRWLAKATIMKKGKGGRPRKK